MIFSLLRCLTFVWKLVSFPILGERCRFYPSCSEYMLDAVKVHGVWKGGYLSVKRVSRCHPLCKGGLDFVPENNNNNK